MFTCRWIIAEPSIMFIKMADQIHNVWTMDFLRPDKQLRKISELEEYFIPMYENMSKNLDEEYYIKYTWILQELLDTIEKASK